MKQTLGLRFSHYGQVLACVCDAGDSPLAVGEKAMVYTDQGPNCGIVVWQRPWHEGMEQLLAERNKASAMEGGCATGLPSMPEARRASKEEARISQDNADLSEQAFEFCRMRITARGLEMKLVDVEVLYERSKIIFYFTAPTRIDFRELVKDLVHEYHTRIELRQIGVRHETQMIGALGNCGMVCCCRRFLHRFAPVTIKMAKEQNLFLNPTKISGICGRLLCCLSYEQDNYDAFHHSCPKLGKRYKTDEGHMRVLRSNMFRNSIVVLPDGGQETEMQLEDWVALNPTRSETAPPPSAEEQKTPVQNGSMMIVSASPDTLDDDLAGLEDLEEEDSHASREPLMLGSEEAAHPRRRPRRDAQHPQPSAAVGHGSRHIQGAKSNTR
ncbi:MAG: hypothetical protein J6I40_09000 [Mailhella sp.]|nr:hypothetical protein [Mailhella sp.]